MKNVIILTILVLLFGVNCDAVDRASQDETKATINNINYYKDIRTNICFAALHLGWDNGAVTAVPCTPEVEKLLK
jgi:hypothetical protein